MSNTAPEFPKIEPDDVQIPEGKSFEEWIDSHIALYETRTLDIDNTNGVLHITNRGKFGGRIGKNYGATGFFRSQKIEGQWIMVDPEGYQWFQLACKWLLLHKTLHF